MELPSPLPDAAASATAQKVQWKDARFEPAIAKVRAACGLSENDYEDDPMIGMLLDRYSWDQAKVVELYKRSLERRLALGVSKIKEDIVRGGLGLDDLPHARAVKGVVRVNGTSSLE